MKFIGANGAIQQLVSFPEPTMHARKGSGDIGADSWFCMLSNHVIICIDCIGACAVT